MTQLFDSIPATSIRNLASRNLVVRCECGDDPAHRGDGYLRLRRRRHQDLQHHGLRHRHGSGGPGDDVSTAHNEPRTGLAQYSVVAQSSGGALGDYRGRSRTWSLKATAGDFARQVAALDSAHTRDGLGRGTQGR